MTIQKAIILLIHAFAGWALCAATMGIGQALLPIQSALIVHAAGAPIYFTLVSLVYFKKFNYTPPLQTALIFTGFVMLVDFFGVALLMLHSLAMFASPLGTWIPFMLILASTYLTGSFAIQGKNQNRSALQVFAATFGSIMALAGLEHGFGESLQGSARPAGLMIQSWPEAAFFRSLGGEPAMTVIPNLQLTGVLAVIASLVLLCWSLLYVQRKNGGLMMILISIALLLFGGGIFPPVFAALIGAVATRIHTPLVWWRKRLPAGQRDWLAKIWPWAFGICVPSWLLMLVGPGILDYFFGIDPTAMIGVFLLLVVASLLLTMVSSFARDLQAQTILAAGKLQPRPGR